MDKQEYLARAEADETWAPGWLAIEEAFDAHYPGVRPEHFATDFAERAMLGGNQHLDGFSVYPSPKGFQHIVTFGLSALYADEECLGGEHSGWGYELTMKVRSDDPFGCNWAFGWLSGLARYTARTNRWFDPYEFVSGQGRSLFEDSALTSCVMVPDTEIPGRDTVHGRLEFLQVVGITQQELDWLAAEGPAAGGERARELVARMQADDPLLVTDLGRTKEYV